MMKRYIGVLGLVFVLCSGCGNNENEASAAMPVENRQNTGSPIDSAQVAKIGEKLDDAYEALISGNPHHHPK